MDDALSQKVLETIQESCADYRGDCIACMFFDPKKYCALDIDELGGLPFYWDLDKFFDRMEVE